MNFRTKKIDSKAMLLSASAVISIMPFAKVEAEKKEPVKRPNIIFIMSDDHAYQAISAYKELHQHPTSTVLPIKESVLTGVMLQILSVVLHEPQYLQANIAILMDLYRTMDLNLTDHSKLFQNH